MKRDVDCQWRLAELMAGNHVHNSITLSRPQVYRLVHQRAERVSLKLIAALCDIFDCSPDDLVTVTAADARKKAASAGAWRPGRSISRSAGAIGIASWPLPSTSSFLIPDNSVRENVRQFQPAGVSPTRT